MISTQDPEANRDRFETPSWAAPLETWGGGATKSDGIDTDKGNKDQQMSVPQFGATEDQNKSQDVLFPMFGAGVGGYMVNRDTFKDAYDWTSGVAQPLQGGGPSPTPTAPYMPTQSYQTSDYMEYMQRQEQARKTQQAAQPRVPTNQPTTAPTHRPAGPTNMMMSQTNIPTNYPTLAPSQQPTAMPTQAPTQQPTQMMAQPPQQPTQMPTSQYIDPGVGYMYIPQDQNTYSAQPQAPTQQPTAVPQMQPGQPGQAQPVSSQIPQYPGTMQNNPSGYGSSQFGSANPSAIPYDPSNYSYTNVHYPGYGSEYDGSVVKPVTQPMGDITNPAVSNTMRAATNYTPGLNIDQGDSRNIVPVKPPSPGNGNGSGNKYIYKPVTKYVYGGGGGGRGGGRGGGYSPSVPQWFLDMTTWRI